MGDYRGLRFKAKLNRDGLRAATMLSTFPWRTWEEVQAAVPTLDIGAFAALNTLAIPCGVVLSMPQDWRDQGGHRVENGVWHVCCSTKYHEHIDQFVQTVLPQLIDEPVTVEIRNEWGDPWFVNVLPNLLPIGNGWDDDPLGGAPIIPFPRGPDL